MRAFRSRCRRAISALPIVDHAFSSLLPTVTTGDYGSNAGGARPGPRRPSLRVLLPTATTKANHSHKTRQKGKRVTLQDTVKLLPTLTTNGATYAGHSQRPGYRTNTLPGIMGGQLSPRWLEWFMGFPAGWTDNMPSATRSYRRKRRR